MNTLKQTWQRFFQTASLPRTYLETLLFYFALTLIVVQVYGTTLQMLYPTSLMFFINPCCALYYSLRLKPARSGKIRQLFAELTWLFIGGLFVVALEFIIFPINSALDASAALLPIALISTVLLFPYIFFRTFSRLAVWWGRLCERHLIWSLMNSHLVAVALVQAAIVVPIILLIALSMDNTWMTENLSESPLTWFFYRLNIALPLLGMSILAALLVLIVLLPGSALVSYFFARRMKRRLDALLNVAHAARDGDYRIRVSVTGQDEIARLQTDFNAMIASLETNVNALHGEREKVATLLQLRRDLMANVSHELRTPIATIRAYLESAHRTNVGLTGDDLIIFERETQALQTLIDDLFTLSRAETDHLSLNIESTHLPSLIHRVIETVAPLAWRTNRVEVAAQVPAWMPHIQADATRLEQALRNLIHNSLRHTLPGGLVVISACQKGEFVEIEVRDTGEGIAAEDLPHIWERFYRGAKNGGTGLGLALVKSFIEAMNGHVTAESTVGEGTCFTLSLPLSNVVVEDENPLPKPQPVPHLIRPLA